MRVENFVQEHGLVLEYTRTLIFTEEGSLKGDCRRNIRRDDWHCGILYRIFDFPILIEKEGKEGPILVSASEINTSGRAREESRLELIRQIRGRKMVIVDLTRTRIVEIPADLE
ncbi:MAG: hypothetical protein UY20_C0006G0004 [Candidatus Yanofskybacteria bacterium GW2011_GWA1_48_10]|nr:MAG: hypothetical protein UY20_C0006G0004 [Candidatus Yanofskybacteria bacterium GW2011_GWA1_48_10]